MNSLQRARVIEHVTKLLESYPNDPVYLLHVVDFKDRDGMDGEGVEGADGVSVRVVFQHGACVHKNTINPEGKLT